MKDTELVPDGTGNVPIVFGAGQEEAQLWIEATAWSSLRNIVIIADYEHAGVHYKDFARATAVWSVLADYELATRPDFNQVDASGNMVPGVLNEDPWSHIPATHNIHRLIDLVFDGTGIRPLTPTRGIRNVIVQAWRPMPLGILNEPQVKFDITRRKEGLTKIHAEGLDPFITDISEFPISVDAVNDDESQDDEGGPFEKLLFVIDAPGRIGLPGATSPTTKIAYRNNFEEFVRISVNGDTLTGNGDLGSRGSDKFKWHSHAQMHKVGAGWERTANYNKIGEEHDFANPD